MLEYYLLRMIVIQQMDKKVMQFKNYGKDNYYN